MKISIVIPVYNEEKTLPELIRRITSVDLNLEKEIIFIDDASTDKSREILKEYDGIYKVIFQPQNIGKGRAVIEGFKAVTGDIVLIQDADLEYDPKDYSILIKPILDNEADVVYGSRFLEPKNNKVVYKRGYLFSRFLNYLSGVLSGTHLNDMYTCYKVFSKEAINLIYPKLTSKRFGIDPELTAWVSKLDLRVSEVPISYQGRTYKEGKKITWKDGIAAIFHIIKFNVFTRK